MREIIDSFNKCVCQNAISGSLAASCPWNFILTNSVFSAGMQLM